MDDLLRNAFYEETDEMLQEIGRDFYDDIGIKVAYNLDEKIDIESYNN